MQWAGWNATPELTETPKANNYSIIIKQIIEEERILLRNWHRLCTSGSITLLNAATQEFK
jgi:hypothetical protein